MGNSTSNVSIINDESKKHSKVSSSFGDPLTAFTQNFQKWANEDRIPGLDSTKKYQIYLWRPGVLDHWSVVIGCQSRSDVGFITMELYVDIDQELIFPVSQYFERGKGEKFIKQGKWRSCDTTEYNWNGEVETTMRMLIDLALDLIENHGKYSEILNSCQDFAYRFILKCAKKQEKGWTPRNNAFITAVTGSVYGGGVGGALIGSAIGGPPGATAGAAYGTLSALFGFALPMLSAKTLHDRKAKKVKLKSYDDFEDDWEIIN